MKTAFELTWKWAAVTLAALFGTFAVGAFVQAVFGNVFESSLELSDLFLPMLAATALTVAALVYPARRSGLPPKSLFLALFLTVLGIGVLLVQVEAFAFLDMSTKQILAGIVHSALVGAWTVFLVVRVFGRSEAAGLPPAAMPGRRLAGRISIATVCYVVLYLGAGTLIYPQVQAFYESQNFSAGAWMFPLQFVRGALYVAFAYWLIRSLQATRWQTALAMAVLFPVLAGVAALLIPNAIMPDHVRHWHLLEVGCSNFLYGLLVGYLFWAGPQRSADS